MKTYLKYILPAVAIAACVGLTSCTGDLDITPIDPQKILKRGIEKQCRQVILVHNHPSGQPRHFVRIGYYK